MIGHRRFAPAVGSSVLSRVVSGETVATAIASTGVSSSSGMSSRVGLGLVCLLATSLLACSKEEAAPEAAPAQEAKEAAAPSDAKAGEAKPAEPAAAAPATAPATSLQPTAWAPAVAPKAVTLRPGAPTIVAQFTGKALVPVASKRTDSWLAEEVLTLDKLPEGKNGKDAAPEVLVAWWNRLDIQPGDRFELIGSQGARGAFVARRELASADRGGCMGLVIAIPGTVTWTTKPAGSVTPSGDEEPAEQVWAVRAPFEAGRTQAVRALTDGEKASAGKALEAIRNTIRTAQPALASGVTWQECDSFNAPTCKGRRNAVVTFDLEGNGMPDVMTTVQLKTSNGAQTLESRVLLGVQETSAIQLGKWDGTAKGSNEDMLPPGFAGAMDLTGDGRQELIFHRTVNETENWSVYSAGDKPGQWIELFKTAYEGC